MNSYLSVHTPLRCCAAGAVCAPVVAASIPLRSDDIQALMEAAIDYQLQPLAKAEPKVRVGSR